MDQNEMRRRLNEIADEQEKKKKFGTSTKAGDGGNVVIKILTFPFKLIVRLLGLAIGLAVAFLKFCSGFFFQ